MKCPACEATLVFNQTNEQGFWSCEKCGGLWMPFGALERLIEMDGESWEASDDTAKNKNETIPEGQRLCPEDNTLLSGIPYHIDEKIRIDKCSKCSGVWLDAGELAKILNDENGVFHALATETKEDATALEVFLGKILPFLPR